MNNTKAMAVTVEAVFLRFNELAIASCNSDASLLDKSRMWSNQKLLGRNTISLTTGLTRNLLSVPDIIILGKFFKRRSLQGKNLESYVSHDTIFSFFMDQDKRIEEIKLER
ncbi:hypothetical protein V1478_001910 [Vespula squamosa]|uniref:Uncharacterized protein n=1 Tax=Vespula squamosa TaxID=30214 RepID=A0ABD2BYK4_VESSQ